MQKEQTGNGDTSISLKILKFPIIMGLVPFEWVNLSCEAY